MSSDRRPQLAQRRRRVIYAHGIEATGGRTSSAAKACREARRPAAAYGSRVHRRLRARWFGLVPVRRRTLTAVVASVATLAMFLTFGHWAAIGWAPLAYAPQLARPLRLDQPDSFGTWLGTLLLFSGAGASLLIYQLRRYRSDDYQGRYRIWRPVMLLLAAACLDSVVGLVDWGGHLLDACLGERKALSGGDWIRLVLAVGGVALSLRLVAEVWQSRLATIALALGSVAFAYPALVHWKIAAVDSPLSSTFYSAAPLLGRTAIWVSLLAYLRLLYRDVRKISANDRLADRLRNLRLVRLWNAESAEPLELETPPAKKPAAKTPAAEKPAADRPAVKKTAAEKPDDPLPQQDRPPRRWFGLRKAAVDAPAADDDGDADSATPLEDAPAAKKSWLSWRSPEKKLAKARLAEEKRAAAQLAKQQRAEEKLAKAKLAESKKAEAKQAKQQRAEEKTPAAARGKDAPEGESSAAGKRRWGLGWLGKRQDSADTEPSSGASKPQARSTVRRAEADASDDEEADDPDLDPNSIDWDSLSKSERRRVKRQLKRQDRAA